MFATSRSSRENLKSVYAFTILLFAEVDVTGQIITPWAWKVVSAHSDMFARFIGPNPEVRPSVASFFTFPNHFWQARFTKDAATRLSEKVDDERKAKVSNASIGDRRDILTTVAENKKEKMKDNMEKRKPKTKMVTVFAAAGGDDA